MILYSDFNCLNERVTVDRRRIEEAFFQYALLKVIAWYPQHFSIGDLPLHAKTVHVLPSVVSTYHGAFMERYAGLCVCKPSTFTHNFNMDIGQQLF